MFSAASFAAFSAMLSAAFLCRTSAARSTAFLAVARAAIFPAATRFKSSLICSSLAAIADLCIFYCELLL